MTTHPPRKRPRPELSSEQKAAFAILLFLGLGGIILGFLSFGANLRRPFDIQYVESLAKGRYLTQDQQDAEEVRLLKERDTDGDGITDYDELYVFKTSPYLTDTDSDGFDDRVEIFSDHDPNCPRGTECGGLLSADSEADTSKDPSELLNSVNSNTTQANSIFDNTAGVKLETEADIQTYFKSLTTDQIRQALLDQGLSQEQVDSVSDEEIRTLFDAAIDDAAVGGEFDTILNQQLPDTTTDPNEPIIQPQAEILEPITP